MVAVVAAVVVAVVGDRLLRRKRRRWRASPSEREPAEQKNFKRDDEFFWGLTRYSCEIIIEVLRG